MQKLIIPTPFVGEKITEPIRLRYIKNICPYYVVPTGTGVLVGVGVFVGVPGVFVAGAVVLVGPVGVTVAPDTVIETQGESPKYFP